MPLGQIHGRLADVSRPTARGFEPKRNAASIASLESGTGGSQTMALWRL